MFYEGDILERRETYWQMYFCFVIIEDLISDPVFNFKDKIDGFCEVIFQLKKLYGIDAYDFKELLALRPKRIRYDFQYWFKRNKSGVKKRQQLLLKAIELTYINDDK